jgi:phosphoinositide-3-kinase regulatory subunit 4
VPQTVFLKTRASDFTTRSSRRSRGSTFDVSGRMQTLGTSRTSRVSSLDYNNNATPFEDLRRRLATINASNSSLSATLNPRDPKTDLSSSTQPIPTGGPSTFSSPLERPGSPTESVVSTTDSLAFQANKLHIGGHKAAPAVGSSRANATGLLEARSKLRSDGSPERSGRSSPTSMSTTIRGPQRSRVPSVLPISTYGMLRHCAYDIFSLTTSLDGQEPGISNMLENLYLDNNREFQHDFGPKVHEGPVRRRNTVRHSFISRDGTPRRLEATLIAHLTSHSDVITSLAVSPDHTFFVSSSDDKTVKVWDTARLERNVTSKPRHTYGQHHARVKCVCFLEGSHCFASAAVDGSLHVVRVHVSQNGALPKYNKLQVIREHRVDHIGEYITCMSHHNTGIPSPTLIRYSLTCLQIHLRTSSTPRRTRRSPYWTYEQWR